MCPMGTVPCSTQHRGTRVYPFLSACAARPVSRKELLANPKALKARDKEWGGQRKRRVVDLASVREWADVSREARKTNKTIHSGRLFGICVENGLRVA